METPKHFAHTLADRPEEDWQSLEAHLVAVSDLASEFASTFDAADWGRVAGLWHDLGKYSREFQAYLRASTSDLHEAEMAGRVDHSTAGAQHAAASVPILGYLMAFIIAGHHAGLGDFIGGRGSLEARVGKAIPDWSAAPSSFRDVGHLLVAVPPLRTALLNRDGLGVALFTRMVFSCLVDADFLDTEAFMSPERGAARPRWPDDILDQIIAALERHVAAFGTPADDLAAARREVYEACCEAGAARPGLFSLTVPTGGGKTLSSMAFALRHARARGLQRVIYVIPFTSIIEQNAAVFRSVLEPLTLNGIPDPIIEHHGALDSGRETTASRLATENWDAPIIVTTSVQFFESLFASRTSKARKLHNIASSVVIFDEAQSLPVELLEPCLALLSTLSRSYDTSVVLCTATQPAVVRRRDFPIGLEGVREIAPDPAGLHRRLKRVESIYLGRVPDADLVEAVVLHRQVLCIVNTRRHARDLHEALHGAGDCYHLSALMCAEHRSARITEIRGRLEAGEPCRLISTQLLEAGVDIDFPVVFRALAGVDSLAQAAGRCNREGRLEGLGRLYVFESEHRSRERFLAGTADAASQVLATGLDALSLDAVEEYFHLYYWDRKDSWDREKVLELFRIDSRRPNAPFPFAFKEAARRFRLIKDAGKPVIVPWGSGARLCDQLRALPDPPRGLLRRLQRFQVTVPEKAWQDHLRTGAIELVHERFPVLSSPELYYSEIYGLSLGEPEATVLFA